MGTLESEDGGWCCSLLKLLFSVLCPCLSSIIILHNSLIDFCVTTNGRGEAQQTLKGNVSAQSLLKECACFPCRIGQGPLMPQNSGRTLCFNISVTTVTWSLSTGTGTGCFLATFPPRWRGSLIHLKWRGDLLYRLHWSQLRKRATSREDAGRLRHLPSSLRHREPSQTIAIAWPHSCTRCKGRQVRLHTITTDDGIPFQLHFRSRAEGVGGGGEIPWCILLWLRQI